MNLNKLKKWRTRISTLLIVSIVYFLLDNPGIFSQPQSYTKQISQSEGTVSNGSLKNGIKLPYKGENYKYFSKLSYYILNRAYVNAKVYNTVLEAYKTCEATCPNVYFRVMECSRRHGGKIVPHRTHQNGLSVDFMIPLKKGGKQYGLYDKMGEWHYLLNADENGNVTKSVEIDFETLAKHILALDDAARKNGLMVKKVILKINLKDDLFKTESGKKLKQRGIYFVMNLSKTIDNLHDDHYHVDFEEIK